jgi:hypothetical protein
MAMDLSAIKAKLNSLQSKPGSGNGPKLSEVIWKPSNGKHTVRIVPSVFNKSNPFRELFFHYGIGNLKVAISPRVFGEKDPIADFADELKKGEFDRDNWSLSKKLAPKMRVFAPVIVRGEEDKGVRLWEFGTEVYKELLAIADDEDVQDYTDPINGRDLTVEKLDPAAAGNSFGKTNIRVRTKITALSEDASQVQSWLTTQPDPNGIFKKYDYETLKTNLLEFLNPGEEIPTAVEEVSTTAAETEVASPTAAPAPYTLESAAKPKKSVDDEFAALFGND